MLGTLMHLARRYRTKASRGLTLVELMVVLAIAAVLFALALPSFREFIARKRLEGTAQELVTDLRLLKAYQIQNRPGNGTSININATKLCYILYTRGNGGVQHCDCGQTEALKCGAAGTPGRPVAFRQVDIPASSGITIATTPTRLTVNGYHGLPMFETTLSVKLSVDHVGELLIANSESGVPSICAKSGSFSSIPAC